MALPEAKRPPEDGWPYSVLFQTLFFARETKGKNAIRPALRIMAYSQFIQLPWLGF